MHISAKEVEEIFIIHFWTITYLFFFFLLQVLLNLFNMLVMNKDIKIKVHHYNKIFGTLAAI